MKTYTNSFLEMLDVVAFMIHLKMSYHNDSGHPTIVKADIREARLMYEATLKNSLTSVTALRKGRKTPMKSPT